MKLVELLHVLSEDVVSLLKFLGVLVLLVVASHEAAERLQFIARSTEKSRNSAANEQTDGEYSQRFLQKITSEAFST